jgi:hypothetical protein
MRFALALILAAASPAKAHWTFCVAEAGQDVWISEVFAVVHKRERLEAEFSASLRAFGVSHPDVQCPEPQDDKTDAFNAQFTAAEFHRKLGQTLHAAAAPVRR